MTNNLNYFNLSFFLDLSLQSLIIFYNQKQFSLFPFQISKKSSDRGDRKQKLTDLRCGNTLLYRVFLNIDKFIISNLENVIDAGDSVSMVVSKIPETYTKEVLEKMLTTMSLTQIATLIGVTKGTLSKYCSKLKIDVRAVQSGVVSETDRNIETKSKSKHGGRAGKTATATGGSAGPEPPNSPPEQTAPKELTPEFIEAKIIQNLQFPDPAMTAAIGQAQGWLRTKEALKINDQTDEVIAKSCKQMTTDNLVRLVMDSEESEPIESSQWPGPNSQKGISQSTNS